MPTKDVNLQIENWMEGEVIERVNRALERVIKNCLDANYDASPRKIKLTIKLNVNTRRDEAYPDFHIETIMGRLKFTGVALAIGIDPAGRGVAREYIDRQQQLFNQGVTPLRREGDA